MLFNNPKGYVGPSSSNIDGTYLHEDIVFRRIVEKLTPPTIYNANKEFIEAFTKTVVNYSPVSINILDFWNKTEQKSVVVPLKNSIFNTINEDKIYNDNLIKAFYINSIKGLQDKLAEVYMNNFYTTTYKTRNSYILRQKLYQIFTKFEIPNDKKSLLFSDINKLFREERFVTNKDFSTKKGKVTAINYTTRSAYEASIEGPLKSESFFFNYIEKGPFEYEVESSLLTDVFNSFVKPIAHPLGMGIDYKKICNSDLTDRVFNKLRHTSSAVSIKCTFPSDQSPFTPPPVLLPYIINPDYIDENTTPDIPKWVVDLPWPSAVQNTEIIKTDESILGPWDPANPNDIPEIIFATTDGYNLSSFISDLDEGEGNILYDVQYGYGDEEYAGMNYTQYIFENRSYIIEYVCKQNNGRDKHIIEYYRYDVFDTSIHKNIYQESPTLPLWAYPAEPILKNMVHGEIIDLDPFNTRALKSQNPFTISDDPTPGDSPNIDNPDDTGGFDSGVWFPLEVNYPTREGSFDPLTPGSYNWDIKTNIITTEPQFTEIYSLVARFIENRGCMVNTYTLKTKEEISIKEEFSIRRIDTQRNIIHLDQNVVNYSPKDKLNTNILNNNNSFSN